MRCFAIFDHETCNFSRLSIHEVWLEKLMESMIGNEIGVSKMSVYEVGRVAVKTHGREAGVRCVVVDIIDRSFLLVDGPKTRRRRCNVKHLVPTPDKIEMEKGADHKGVLAAIKSANMMKKLEERINLNL